MKSDGKAQDKRERKNKPALAGRIPKKIGNRQNLTGKRSEDCQKRKTVNGGIRRTKTGRKLDREIGRLENREAGKPKKRKTGLGRENSKR